MNKRWLVDFDSTLNTLDNEMICRVNQRFGTSYAVADIDRWAWWDEGVTPKQRDFVWGTECFNSEEFTMSLRPQPNAVETLHRLMERGDEIFIVSDRPDHMFWWVVDWMSANRLDDVSIILTNKNFYPKWQVACEYELTHVIEDAPHNITSLWWFSNPQVVYVMDRAWNRELPLLEDSQYTRINSWTELAELEFGVEAVAVGY